MALPQFKLASVTMGWIFYAFEPLGHLDPFSALQGYKLVPVLYLLCHLMPLTTQVPDSQKRRVRVYNILRHVFDAFNLMATPISTFNHYLEEY